LKAHDLQSLGQGPLGGRRDNALERPLMIDVAALHRATLTLDSHIDIPWPNPANPFANTDRHVDLPKMRAGGLDAGCFVAFVPQGPRTEAYGQEAGARALAMLETIRAMGRVEAGIEARVCSTAGAVEAAHRDGVLAIVPAVENGAAIGSDLGMLERLAALGVVYVTLCHNGHNLLCDSANPRRDLGDAEALHGGLSPLGREVVAEMNRLGLLVDVSHLSRQSMLQALQLSAAPVVATHSCVAALCPHPRNLDDTQLDALRDTGGLVQITAMPPFLRNKGRGETVTVSDFCDHVDYVVRRIGLAHCGISSDFDGGGAITGWRHAGESLNITAELVRRGYGHAEIAALWGGNFLRVMRAGRASAAGREAPVVGDAVLAGDD
jgi:membrane dipeptidase